MPTQSELDTLRREAAELKAALKHERARADLEHRRAEAATESAHRAWRVALSPSKAPREDH